MDKGLKTALIIGGIFLTVITIPNVIGALTLLGFGMGYGMMGGLTMGLMGVFWVVVLGLIIWAVVTAARGTGGSLTGGTSESALDILKKRYARGEINKAEYEEKKKDLT